MKSYTLLGALTLLSFVSTQIHAEGATIGIGVAVDDDVKIYLPIITDQLLIEPSIVMRSIDRESTGSASQNTNNFDALEIGLGIFKYSNVTNSTYIYYGTRFGYIEIEQENSNKSSTSVFTSSQDNKEDGYFIAPTIGAEHYLTNNFSIGIDVSFNYSKTEGTEINTFGGTTTNNDTKRTERNTETEVLVRYYF